jgi:urea transporter
MPRPALPLGRWLPCVLAVVGALLILWGLLRGDRETVLAGVVGVGAVLVAFPLGSLVTRRADHDEE